MKLLALILTLSPLFADDPLGFVVWKSADLKQHETTQELHGAVDYQAVVVHQTGNGGGDASDLTAELLVIESGAATLMTGGKIQNGVLTGGATTELLPGDVVHIPARLARQVFVARDKEVTYLVIRQRGNAEEAAVPAPADPNVKPQLGIETGAGYRSCIKGDLSPSGTVFEGYKKLVGYSFMGPTCVWARDDPQNTPADLTNSKDKPRIGIDMGSGFRSCVPGDETPSGTVVDGYRKESHPSPFGLSCAWEKIK